MIEDGNEDEVINVRLPRSEAKLLKAMIKREEAFSWLSNSLRNSFVWVIAGGLLSVLLFWEKIKSFTMGVTE